jgi:hypothetical protein
MSLKSLIQSIGKFFDGLFRSTKKAFNELPEDQKDAIIKGVNISELIKSGYTLGPEYLINAVATGCDVSKDVARGVIDHVLKSWGINSTDIQSGLDKLAERIEDGLTDDGWNGLWEVGAKAAASWLSTGRLNWITLGLGVLEFAYQKIFKGVK